MIARSGNFGLTGGRTGRPCARGCAWWAVGMNRESVERVKRTIVQRHKGSGAFHTSYAALSEPPVRARRACLFTASRRGCVGGAKDPWMY